MKTTEKPAYVFSNDSGYDAIEPEEAHSNYERFLNKYKEALIPYAGRVLDCILRKDADITASFLAYGRSWWVVPPTHRVLHDLASDFDVLSGRRSDGQDFFTSPIGLIFVDHKSIAGKPTVLEPIGTSSWLAPAPEWYLESFRRKDFFTYVPKYRCEEIEREYTKEAILRKESELAKRMQETHDKAASLLERCGFEATEERITLAITVGNFDVTYDYSDDHKFCISYRQHERQLREKLKEEGIEPILDRFIGEFWGKK